MQRHLHKLLQLRKRLIILVVQCSNMPISSRSMLETKLKLGVCILNLFPHNIQRFIGERFEQSSCFVEFRAIRVDILYSLVAVSLSNSRDHQHTTSQSNLITGMNSSSAPSSSALILFARGSPSEELRLGAIVAASAMDLRATQLVRRRR
jgi:hypothetical protein